MAMHDIFGAKDGMDLDFAQKNILSNYGNCETNDYGVDLLVKPRKHEYF